MYENTHIQTVVIQEPPIAGTFVKLNVLSYEKAKRSDQSVSFNHKLSQD